MEFHRLWLCKLCGAECNHMNGGPFTVCGNWEDSGQLMQPVTEFFILGVDDL